MEFILKDEIAGEILTFKFKLDVESEADRRMFLYTNGYYTKRRYIYPVNAALDIKDNQYIIHLI